MNILICDDEPLARDRLKRLLIDVPDCQVVAECTHGKEAIEFLETQQADVVLMDIRMPGIDGLEAARHISQMSCPPAIIFCTAYDDYALNAFQVHAIDYLLKPIRKELLIQALSKARSLNRAQLNALAKQEGNANAASVRTHISAKTHRGIELIPVNDIRYFLADQKYVTVRHGSGEILVDEPLKELETEFGDRFVRVHRNALVGTAFIEALETTNEGQFLKMKGINDKLQVSRRHLAGVKALMLRL